MADSVAIDLDWLNDHPLPVHPSDTDKHSRGHVLVIGGSPQVPGGVRLTGEAALRAGAGRLQFAVPRALAIPLGLAVPEAGVLALPENAEGEIEGSLTEDLRTSLLQCDCVVVGPAMTEVSAARSLANVLGEASDDRHLVIDAAAIAAFGDAAKRDRAFDRRAVFTPNGGEMAGLLHCSIEEIAAAPEKAVREAVERSGATVVFKSDHTLIGTPDGDLLSYRGGSIGLATGGSGDVLAGVLGGLLARGTSVRDACAWAVWLHGESGRRLTEQIGPVGFFARELLIYIPALMRSRR